MLVYKRVKNIKKTMKNIADKTVYKENDEKRAIINIGAENYDDIFSPYCYKDGDSLSSELVDYLESKADGVPLDKDLVMRFHVKNASEEKREKVESAVRENFKKDIIGIKREMHRNDIFSLIFFIIGVSLYFTWIFLNTKMPVVLSGIVDLLSWVMCWEALDAFFLNRRMLQTEKLKRYRLWASKIEIIEFEEY